MPIERLRKINGVPIVEIRVADMEQLFDHRDPAPFRQRELDEEFASYLETSVDEIPRKIPIRIEIKVEGSSRGQNPDTIREAIYAHYNYQIKLKKNQLSKGRKTAHLFLLIGLSILAVCLGISYGIKDSETELISSTLREGVVIFGWVSMWRPLELLLFDWYPFHDRMRTFKRILNAEMEVQFKDVEVHPPFDGVLGELR